MPFVTLQHPRDRSATRGMIVNLPAGVLMIVLATGFSFGRMTRAEEPRGEQLALQADSAAGLLAARQPQKFLEEIFLLLSIQGPEMIVNNITLQKAAKDTIIL